MCFTKARKEGPEHSGPFPILCSYSGILTHYFEITLYHFGTGHGECNAHLGRYLFKNAKKRSNRWNDDMELFLKGLKHARNEWKSQNDTAWNVEQLERFRLCYDWLVTQGYKANPTYVARWQERSPLNQTGCDCMQFLTMFLYVFRWNIEVSYYEQKIFWSLCKTWCAAEKILLFRIQPLNIAL